MDLLRTIGQGPKDPPSGTRCDHPRTRVGGRPRRDWCVPPVRCRESISDRLTCVSERDPRSCGVPSGRAGPVRPHCARLLRGLLDRRARAALHRTDTAETVLRATRRGLIRPEVQPGTREIVMRGDGLCAGVLRPQRGRPGWAVPLLLFLAVLIVSALAFNLANLNTGGEAIPVVPGAGGMPASQVGNLASDPTAEAVVLIMTTLLFA